MTELIQPGTVYREGKKIIIPHPDIDNPEVWKKVYEMEMAQSL